MPTATRSRTSQSQSASQSRGSGLSAALALERVDVEGLDVAGVEAAVAQVAQVRNWVSAIESKLVLRADALASVGRGSGGRETSRTSGKRSSRGAAKASARAGAVKANPTLGEDLEFGDITEDHLDGLAGAAKDLDNDKKDELFNDPALTDAARRMPPEAFGKLAKKKAAKLAEDEGRGKLAKQKAATNLRTWIRKSDGMFIVNGEFDPEIGSELVREVEAEMEAIAGRDRRPKNDNTRAAALAALVQRGHGAGPSTMPPEVMVIDKATATDGLHDHSVCETESGVALPPDTIRRAMCNCIVVPTVINGADGQVLSVGREQRVATRAQRRALRAMYATCAFDGCDVEFTRCQMHHIIPWADNGRTDLDNLIPLCGRHHHLVHEGQWQIALRADRTLDIWEPSGRHFKTVPLIASGVSTDRAATRSGSPGSRERAKPPRPPRPPHRPSHN